MVHVEFCDCHIHFVRFNPTSPSLTSWKEKKCSHNYTCTCACVYNKSRKCVTACSYFHVHVHQSMLSETKLVNPLPPHNDNVSFFTKKKFDIYGRCLTVSLAKEKKDSGLLLPLFRSHLLCLLFVRSVCAG